MDEEPARSPHPPDCHDEGEESKEQKVGVAHADDSLDTYVYIIRFFFRGRDEISPCPIELREKSPFTIIMS